MLKTLVLLIFSCLCGFSHSLLAQPTASRNGGVQYIDVADARIFPANARMDTFPDGRYHDLKGAIIQCNQVTNYHRFYDADVHIASLTKYTAIATYDWPSIGGKKYGIPFALQVQGDSMTIGAGVLDADTFYLTEGFRFRGKVNMTSQAKYMRFVGEVQVDLDHPFFKDRWFKADLVGNPDSIILPIEGTDLSKRYSGLHFDAAKRDFYTTFLGPKRDLDDPNVALASGAITFDRTTNEFRIGPYSKLTGKDYRGNTFAISMQGGIRTVVGKLDFPTHIQDKTITMSLAGMWREDITRNEPVTKLVGQFDFDCIPKDAWEALQDKASLVLAINNTVDWNDHLFLQGLAEMLDPKPNHPPKNMQEFQTQVERSFTYLDIKAATVNPVSLFLAGMEPYYDAELNSLWYSGEVDILGIAGRPINKRSTSNTKIEYVFAPTATDGTALSDTLRIYLEFDELNWVFFEWYDDQVRTISSDLDGYNTILRKNQKSKGFRYTMATEVDKDAFLNQLVNHYIWRTNR